MSALVAAVGGHTPRVAADAWLAPDATVLGDVTVESQASLWYGGVLRAEMAPIVLGERSNLQDGVIVHTDLGFPTTIGPDVSVGHRAVLHGTTVANNVLVGMGATLLNGSQIGAWSLIAAGAVVREGFVVPEGSLVVGVPGKIARELTDAEREKVRLNAEAYLYLTALHREATPL